MRTPRTPSLRSSALSPIERIEEESIMGLYPLSEAESLAAMAFPSIDTLLRGASLAVQKPGGDQRDHPGTARDVTRELERLLGGWFKSDLFPYVQCYDDLISRQIREGYRHTGVVLPENDLPVAFYYLAFQVPAWQIQAVGALDTFHCIFLGHLLEQTEALREGGHPVVRPLGPIKPLMARATPTLLRRHLADHTAEHAINVFETYLADDRITVKAGVRMRLAAGGTLVSNEKRYFYGIRINLDLRGPSGKYWGYDTSSGAEMMLRMRDNPLHS